MAEALESPLQRGLPRGHCFPWSLSVEDQEPPLCPPPSETPCAQALQQRAEPHGAKASPTAQDHSQKGGRQHGPRGRAAAWVTGRLDSEPPLVLVAASQSTRLPVPRHWTLIPRKVTTRTAQVGHALFPQTAP